MSTAMKIDMSERGRLRSELYQPWALTGGWEVVGTVHVPGEGEAALARHHGTGYYVRLAAGTLRSIDQRAVRLAIEAAS